MTPTSGHIPTRSAALVPVLIGGLGLALSLIAIGVPSLWFDEAATVSASTRTIPQLFGLLGHVDAVHGLYYLIMHGVFDLVGYTPVTLRVPSAVAVGVAAAGVVVLGRLLHSDRAGLIAGIVFCVLPRVVWMGGEGRSYAFTAAAAVWLTISLVVAMRRPTRSPWLIYGVITGLSVMLFIYLALAVLAHGIAVMIAGPARSRIRWLVAAGIGLLAASPVVITSAREREQVAWLPAIGPDTIEDVLRDQWFLGSWPVAIAAFALIIMAVTSMVRRRDPSTILLVALLVVPTVALVLVSLATTLYNPRYLSFGTPFVAILIAVGISLVPWRPVAVLVLVGFIALTVPMFVAHRSPVKANSTWEQLSDRIAVERMSDPPGSTTAFIFGTFTYTTSRVIAVAYPSAYSDAIDVKFVEAAGPAERLFDVEQPLSRSLDRLKPADIAYLLTTNLGRDNKVDRALLKAEGWISAGLWVYGDVRIERFTKN